MSAIQQDAPIDFDAGSDGEALAAEALLKQWADPEDASKKKPSNEGDQESDEPKKKPEDKQAAEKPASEDEGDDEGEAESEDEQSEGEEKQTASDEAYVKIRVGDEEHEVPVSDLKRLYGQEKALTQKSMEVAEQRKAADADIQRNTVATAALLERAQQRWEPYAKLDFQLLATQLAPEDYTALKASAQAAYEDVQFLSQHLDAFQQHIQQQRHSTLKEQALKAREVLSGSVEKGGIEGWSDDLYNDIRAYAVEQGIPLEAINTEVNPVVIRLLHKARLYDRGEAKRAEAGVKTVKVAKGPRKITKTTNSPAVEKDDAKQQRTGEKKFTEQLRRTGSVDDAADLFMARWAKDSDA